VGTALRDRREGVFVVDKVDHLDRPVLPQVEGSLERLGLASVDAFVFHQANQFMLQHLAKRLKLPQDRFVLAMEEFGNTSSASVPLAMSARLADRLRADSMRMVLAGFGVGYSWAAVALTCGPLAMPDVLAVPADAGAVAPEGA
jgi:3-oxoacyl-[acyl-carrier-protein] synthase-3